MASEIRVNQIQNRSGLGTVTFSDTGVSVSGILTATTFSGNLTGNVTGTVSSSGIATFSNGIVVAAGSTSAPSISPSGDSNTGIFFPSADTIAFGEGGAEALRIDSSGRVGISTATMGYQLDVLRQGGETDVARVKGNLGNGFIRFANSNETSHWTLGADGGYPSGSNNNSFILYDRVNSQYRLAVDNSGNLTVNNGNIVIGTAGKGIDFSATANSSGTMTSELLADYEEGTWTPTLTYSTPGTSSFGYTYNTGWYCKIGTLVHVTWDIRLSTFTKGTGAGIPTVAGFPFTSINTGNYARANQVVFLYNWSYQTTAGYLPFISMVQQSSTTAELTVSTSGGVSVNLNDPSSNSMMFGALTYRSAS